MKTTPDLHPTGLHPDSLAARVLDFMDQTRLGLAGLAAAADVVSAECRFNSWVAKEVKGADLSDEWWSRFLDANATNDERCCAAMTAFSAGGPESAFCDEMTAVAVFLNNRSLVQHL